MKAFVGEIVHIQPHPNADMLEVITFTINDFDFSEQLVTGKHYRVGDLGVWIVPGAIIPGWLAHDLWLVGKKRASDPFEVRLIEIRGVESPGLWCGQWYKNDTSKESKQRIKEWEDTQNTITFDGEGYTLWPFWNEQWKLGDFVDKELDIK